MILLFAMLTALGVTLTAPFADAAILDAVTSGCVATLALAGCTTYTNPGTDAATTVTLTGVDAAKAFVVCSTRTGNTEPSKALATCQLAPSGPDSTLTVAFGAAPGNATQTVVQYYVAHFAAGVTVRRAAAALTGTATSAAAAIGATVDCTKTFLLTSTRSTDTATSADSRWLVRSVIGGIDGSTPANPTCTTGTTSTVTLTRTGGVAGTTVTVEWQAVTYEGASVRRGSACIGPGGSCPGAATAGLNTSETIAAVDTSKSFLLLTRQAGTGVSGIEGLTMVRGEFGATGPAVTSVKFSRASGSTTAARQVDLMFEVVQLDDGSVVSLSGVSPTAVGSTAASATSATITTVDPTRAVPLSTMSGVSGTHLASTSYRAVINANAAGSPLDASDLTFTRSATGSTGSVAWFAVSFFRCNPVGTNPAHDPLCSLMASTSAADVTGSVTLDWSSVRAVVIVRRMMVPNTGLTDGTTYCSVSGAPDFCATTNGPGTIVYPPTATPSPSITTFTHSPVVIPITYYYKAFAVIPEPIGDCNTPPCYVGGIEVAVRPRDDQSTISIAGGAALNPVVAGASTATAALGTNNGQILVLDTTAADASLSLSVKPPNTVSAVQGYVSTFTRSDVAADAIVVADQAGYAYSFDPSTGATNWQVKLPATAVKAAPTVWKRSWGSARMHAAYGGGIYDVVFVATANTGDFTDNQVFALRADTGAILWTFYPKTQTYPGVCTSCSMDAVDGQPFLDYARDLLYVASRGGSGPPQNAFWVLDVGASATTPSLKFAAGGGASFTAGPTLSWGALGADDKVLIGGTSGELYTLANMDLPDPQIDWSYSSQTVHAGVGFKSFVWEDLFAPGLLYWVRTDGIVIAYDHAASAVVWQDTTPVNAGAAGCASVGTNRLNQMLVGVGYLWVGACDGHIYQYTLNPAGPPANPPDRSFQVGDGASAVGPVSTATGDELFAATTGAIYKVRLQSESLP